MRWILAILSLLLLAGCELSPNGDHTETLKVFLGGVDNGLRIYSLDPLTGELEDATDLDINVTGRMSLTDLGVLVPSSGVVYRIEGEKVEEFLREDDVFSVAYEMDGTPVALGEKGLYVGSERLDLSVEDVQVGEEFILAISSDGLVLLKGPEFEPEVVEEGNFGAILYDPPYLYLSESSKVLVYIVDDPENPIFDREIAFEGVGDISEIRSYSGDVYVMGNGGIEVHTTSDEFFTVYEGFASDFDVGEGILVLVSDLENSLRIFDVSITSEIEELNALEGLNLSKPSVILGEE